MASEVHALVLALYFGHVTRDMCEHIFGGEIHLEAYVDRRSAFYIVAKDGNTVERRQ